MPIYEYKCDKCGVFEVTQRITENPLKKCPTCQSKVERIISATSFVLKGSGWYVTDYARAGAKKDGAEDSATNAPSESSASSETSGNGTATTKPASETSQPAEKASTKAEKSPAKAE
jgi:putative FmdB family regulatory protein